MPDAESGMDGAADAHRVRACVTMANAPEYQSTPGAGESPSSPAGSSTALLRALALAIDEATTCSLASARGLLAHGTPEADRSAVRMIAVWLMSHPEAAATLRARLRAR